MTMYKISGRVRGTTRVKPEITDPPFSLSMNHSAYGECKIEAEFEDTSFVFNLKTSEPIQDMSALHNDMTEISRSLYDAFGYLEGYALPVDILQIEHRETGQAFIFPGFVPELQASKNERPIMVDLLTTLAVGTPILRHTLSDLREAILSPKDTAFFCFRAIEDIRQMFVGTSDQSERESWKQMSQSLRINRSFVEEIRAKAIPNRHGQFLPLERADRIKLLTKSWKVVDRFILFLHEKEQPLAASLPCLE